MKKQITIMLTPLVFLLSCTTEIKTTTPERQMTVTSGPEKVFISPIEELVPMLENSTMTGENGRVGNEFVFWGYRLETGQDAYLYGCALMEDVDCEQRLTKVCDGPEQVLYQQVQSGQVRYVNCRAIGMAGIGDLLPNCDDRERSSDVQMGLVQCQ